MLKLNFHFKNYYLKRCLRLIKYLFPTKKVIELEHHHIVTLILFSNNFQELITLMFRWKMRLHLILSSIFRKINVINFGALKSFELLDTLLQQKRLL